MSATDWLGDGSRKAEVEGSDQVGMWVKSRAVEKVVAAGREVVGRLRKKVGLGEVGSVGEDILAVWGWLVVVAAVVVG
jgi:hypothetical protein